MTPGRTCIASPSERERGDAAAVALDRTRNAHRHPEFWENPEAFDPERWEGREGRSRAFHPFGAGPRVCIGNNFSLLESHLLLAILAQRFTPTLRRGYEACWEMKGVLNLAGGLPMQIVAR